MKQFKALTTWAGDGQSMDSPFMPQIVIDYALSKWENTADQSTPELPPAPNLLIGQGEAADEVFANLLADSHYAGAVLWFETFGVESPVYAMRSFVPSYSGPDAQYLMTQTQSDVTENDRPCDASPSQAEFDAWVAFLLAHGATQATIDATIGTAVGTRTRAQITAALSDWVKTLTKE